MEKALDIKDLHLKNELLMMRLRCMMKSDELIDEQRKYHIAWGIVSQKLKEIESKKNQTKENMSSMSYSVRYRETPRRLRLSSSARSTPETWGTKR